MTSPIVASVESLSTAERDQAGGGRRATLDQPVSYQRAKSASYHWNSGKATAQIVYMKLSVISAPNLCLSELSDAVVEYIVRMEDTSQQIEEIIQVHI